MFFHHLVHPDKIDDMRKEEIIQYLTDLLCVVECKGLKIILYTLSILYITLLILNFLVTSDIIKQKASSSTHVHINPINVYYIFLVLC